MRNRSLDSALVMTIAAIGLAASSVVAQEAPTADGGDGWIAPRTADGQPDLQGVWDYRTMTPLERPRELKGKAFFTDEEAAEFEQRRVAELNRDRRVSDGLTAVADVGSAYNDFWWDYGKSLTEDNRTALIVEPQVGRIPYTAETAERLAAQRESRRNRGPVAGPEGRGLWERCLTLGVPRLSGAYNNNFQLFQSADYVVILNEMIHDARVIPLDGRPHVGTEITQWLGDSRGRWEGDTLVVETTNFTDKTSFRGSGRGLRLLERFTRIAPDTLAYDVTVEDAATFTQPWRFVVPLKKNDNLMYEYACHEGNYGMVNLLAGARADDRAATEGASR